MPRPSLPALLGPIRALAAFLATATILGAAAVFAASAFLLGVLVYKTGGLMFHLALAGVKLLGAIALTIAILSTALCGIPRATRA